MEKTIVTSGKTIDLAIEAALNQLGLDRDSVSVMVLQQAKAGFLGFGAQPAKVQVTYEAPDPIPEAPKVALSSASRSKPKAKPVEKKPEPKAEAPKPVEKKAEPKVEAPKQPKAEKKVERKPEPKAEAPKAPAEPKIYAPAEPGSVEEKIEQFLKGLLEKMGSDAVPHAVKCEGNTYKVELTGSDLGYLIGRRGDTLDALQYLVSLIANRLSEDYYRVTIDIGNYREKREKSLTGLAKKMGGQAARTGRRVSLEPMNPYERRIIHTAVQEVAGATSWSVGSADRRHVIIGPSDDNPNKDKGNDRGERRGRGERRERRNDEPDTSQNTHKEDRKYKPFRAWADGMRYQRLQRWEHP